MTGMQPPFTSAEVASCFNARSSFPTTTFVTCTLFFLLVGIAIGYSFNMVKCDNRNKQKKINDQKHLHVRGDHLDRRKYPKYPGNFTGDVRK